MLRGLLRVHPLTVESHETALWPMMQLQSERE
jgi:hypothetical protein